MFVKVKENEYINTNSIIRITKDTNNMCLYLLTNGRDVNNNKYDGNKQFKYHYDSLQELELIYNNLIKI